MKPFEVAETFIEQHGRNVPLPELQTLFATSLQELGFSYFSCCTHADPLNARNAPLVLHNYPDEWVRYYSAGSYYRVDPVFRYAEERMTPFFWDDADFRSSLNPAQRQILLDAAAHGIAHGFTVPIRPPGMQMASCSVVPGLPVIERGAYQAVLTMAWYVFDAMQRAASRADCSGARSMQLSERERQCLQLAAQGKDDWSIGSLLRISERTAHNHIERAKRRLGVCTRVQVIVHALSEGQLSFGDVIKAETGPQSRLPSQGADR